MSHPHVRLLEIRELSQVKKEFKRIGADVRSWEIMAPKAIFKLIKISEVPFPAANILKQEMLSLGADAAVARGVITARRKRSPVLLLGTIGQLERLAAKLDTQPFGLDRLAGDIRRLLAGSSDPPRRHLRCRSIRLRLGHRPLMAGVLNVTPDSFSDGGRYDTADAAVDRAHQMVAEGADIVDVGGESTRPGARPVPLKEELRRVVPVIERLSERLKVPVSCDTYKAEVARQALRAGAHIINDISALRFNSKMAAVVAKSDAALILMHMQGTPRNMQRKPHYDDVMAEIYDFLFRQGQKAIDAGVHEEGLVVDPGIGFGKRLTDNLTIIHRLREFHSLGFPILIGVSRKSFIGKVLNLPVDDRLEGTAAAVALAVAGGADIIRVHDVGKMTRVAHMAHSIIQTRG